MDKNINTKFYKYYNGASRSIQELNIEPEFAKQHGLYPVNEPIKLPEPVRLPVQDIVKLPFSSGLGVDGSYGFTDEQLAKYQDESQSKHNSFLRTLLIVLTIIVVVIAAIKWWLS